MPDEVSYYVIFSGEAELLICDESQSSVHLLIDKLGYRAVRIDLPTPLFRPESPTQLAEYAFDWMVTSAPVLFQKLVLERYWFPVEERVHTTAYPKSRNIGWDGAIVVDDAANLELARLCMARAMVHWFAVGPLGRLAREAYETRDFGEAKDLRTTLERAALLLDPRVDAFWEFEYDCLDDLRRTWRTSETEELTDHLLRSLEFLANEDQARRQQRFLLAVAIVGAAAAVPTIIDFGASPSGLLPTQGVRISIIAAMLGGIAAVWWKLRQPPKDR